MLSCGGQVAPVVPGGPIRRSACYLVRVSLELGEVIERVGAAPFAGVDQAHVQIPHGRPFLVL
jgi:hypothetical protein